MVVACAIDRPRSLGHHLHQVSQTQRASKMPAHAQDDDSAVKVAPLEQLFGDLKVAHCQPQPIQLVSVADRTALFAPEPGPASSKKPLVGPVARRGLQAETQL
jgi:hypothetical protein